MKARLSRGSVSATQLHEQLSQQRDVYLLDVRTGAEFNAGHIEHAVHVPVQSISGHITHLQFEVRAPVVLICRSGHRAQRAEHILRDAGIRDTHVLTGGMMAWERAGYATMIDPAALVRQRRLLLLGTIASFATSALLYTRWPGGAATVLMMGVVLLLTSGVWKSGSK